MKFGVFGGSFDPIHLGHIHVIIEVKYQLGLDTIMLVPAYRSPHKTHTYTTSDERLRMCEAAIEDYSDLVISDYEVNSGKPMYTIETLHHLKKAYENCEFYLIIGIDQYDNFNNWYRFTDILKEATVVVVSRSCEIVDVRPPFVFVQLPIIEVSSSIIRERIKMGAPFRHFLNLSVYEYIKRNELYGYYKSERDSET